MIAKTKIVVFTGWYREYHYDSLFRAKLRAGEVFPMGGSVLLTEFSSAHSREEILDAVAEIHRHQYMPLIAHAERYAVVDEDFAAALRAADALIQVNADAVLGYDGWYAKRLVWAMLKNDTVDVIASDAHDSAFRPPRMKACYERIAKKLGSEAAEQLLHKNPARILSEGNPEKYRQPLNTLAQMAADMVKCKHDIEEGAKRS